MLEVYPNSSYHFSREIALSVNFASRKEKPKGTNGGLGKSGSCAFFTIVPNPTAPTCNGFDNGIASILEPVDGVGPFAYQWIGGPTTPVWNNRSAGTYTIIVTDLGQGGAPCNTDVFVNEPGPLTVFSMNATPPTCADGCDGSAAPLVIGGNGGYTYNWSSGETGFSASNLCSTFTLDIEDNEGCQYDTTFVFTNVPDQIVIDATIAGVVCNGDEDGSISIVASGGTGGLTFSWTGPNGFSNNTENISNLEPGTYTITVEDASNCSVVESYDIVENPEIVLTPTQTNNLCAGDSEGSIMIEIAGGLLPYVYSWVGPNGFLSSDQNIQDLESGIYSLSVTDAAGCVVLVNVEITNPLPLIVDLSVTDVPCSSEATGAVSASASGGVGPYTYAWTGPSGFVSGSSNISGLVAGTYTLELTDDNGCILIESVNIAEPVEIIAVFDEVSITCTGDNDGGINLSVSGGTPPFSFLWSGPGGFSSTDQNISGLVAGNYNVTITDANNCVLNTFYVLNNPLPILATGVVVDESCSAGGDGSVTLNITGGSSPYILAWSGPSGYSSDQQDISGLSAGSYDLLLTDALGCTANFTFVVDPPLALTANFTQVNNTCFGDADGAITTSPTSGSAPYSYLWIGPGGFVSNAQNISNLIAGEYNLLLTDSDGCISIFSVEILEAPQITISRVITGVSCFGGSNGTISINVTGGTPGYTYQWVGPNGFSSTNEDISGLVAGSYEITVTDVNGCTRTRVFTVPSPADYVIDAVVTDVICSGDSDGAIDINIVVGTGPFTFAWTGPAGFTATSEDIANIPAGSYSVVVTGNLGCTKTQTYTVSESNIIAVDPIVNNISCFGSLDGSIEVSVSGGIAPYAVAWTGPNGFVASGELIENLEPGDYSAEISDAAGCTQVFNFSVLEPSQITGSTTLLNPDCFGSFTGELLAQLSGGSPPYSFAWTGPDGFVGTTAAISGLQSGMYQLTGTDDNGCSYIETIELTDPEEITISVVLTDPSCLNANGSAEATAIGGTGTLTYVWFDSGGNVLINESLLSNVGAGVYTILVTDVNGCEVSEIVTLSDFTGTVTGSVGNASCFGGTDGSIDITAEGGLPPYNYLWSGPDAFTSTDEDITGLQAGTYIVTVTDANGCVSNQAFDVLEPEEIAGNPVVTGFSCLGNDGAINLNVTGGTPDFIISWIGPNGFVASGTGLTSLEAGLYVFTIEDTNGCTVVDSVEMVAAPGIQIVELVTHALCGGVNTGAIEIQISGGLPPYLVDWSGPNGFSSATEDISDLEGGTYSLTVTDDAGCTETFTVDVLQPEPIQVVFDTVQPDCLADNGSISATISGGTVSGDYVIAWTDEFGTLLSSSVDVTGLGPGIYQLAITDDNGCVYEESIPLANPDISVSVDVVPITCFGNTDGGISLVLVEGLQPAVVSWTGPNAFLSNSFVISDLQTGIYEYEVIDANGCVVLGQVALNEPEELSIVPVLSLACFGEDNGSIEISISGGTAPYSQIWTGPDGFSDTSQNIDSLAPGTYQVSITDGNGCLHIQSFDVEENNEITADLVIDNISCFGDSTGAITATIAGGTGAHSLSWQGPNGFVSADSVIDSLIAGLYTVTATDSIGCFAVFSVEVTQPDEIDASVVFESPGCSAIGSPGSISLTATGGTPDYSVMWTGPAGFSSDLFDISGLDPGEYTYSIVDSAGCGPLVGVVELLEATPISIDFVVTNPSCFGLSDGSITGIVGGGIPPYNFAWTGPDGFSSDEVTITSLAIGDYSLFVTDDAGCFASLDFELTQPEPIQVAIVEAIDASCNTSLDGSIEVAVSGGSGPYTFEWIGPNGFTASTPAIGNLVHGMYEISVSDTNGCSAEQTVTIGFMIEVIASAGPDVVVCPNDLPTSVTGSGDNVDLFIWTNLDGDTLGETATVELNFPPGDYTFILIAGNDVCTDQDTLTLTVNQLPQVNAGDDIDVFAEQEFTLGGSPTSPTAINYLWSPSAEGSFVNTASNPVGFVMETTLFVVVVTDVNGCENSDSVLVNILPEVNITSGFTPNGDGVNDTWIIDNMELFPNNVVSVFNRWGALLYQASRYNAGNAWDGTFESKPVPIGTYYYTIELNDPRFPEPFTGPITIYR
jgi:gliding motility-associated-like protein